MQQKYTGYLGIKKRRILTILFCFTLLLNFSIFNLSAAESKLIKKANVSGTFYPAQKQELSDLIDTFLTQTPQLKQPGQLCGLISPHAGLIYSGAVAGYGYSLIRNKNYKTIIILAPSHYFPLEKAATYQKGSFRTPLGDIPVDEALIEEIITKNKNIVYNPQVFEREHSLEVQLPFLQKSLNNFSLVPILLSNHSLDLYRELAQTLAEVIKEKNDILIIASSDMSHFHPDEKAKEIDKQTLKLIKNGKAEELFKGSVLKKNELCGLSGVVTLMLTMEKLDATQIEILHYATSADTTNSDKTRVVGYSSIAFFKPLNKDENKKEKNKMLTQAQKKELIMLAKDSINQYVTSKTKIIPKTTDILFLEPRGAFVTLHKNKKLRGCIGRIIADKPLINVIAETAVEAATGDPRFPPVTKSELPELELEISVLSPLKEITNINEIEVGTHGVIIQKGFNSGLLLPQVATEYGWDREEFLQHTCHKAGLGPNAWRENAQIYIFSAEVFSEE
ncbi:MAG: AmmeMemoRadiSam system protein B [Candidatus Omnitrophota bacterium]